MTPTFRKLAAAALGHGGIARGNLRRRETRLQHGQNRIGPTAQQMLVRGRHAQHVANDGNGQPEGEILDHDAFLEITVRTH